ncbi:Transcription factor Ovo-like 2 [Taenia solium]|eukprot:TsM_000916000 transcript=TsM_000916000 gene=TsM_000916000
MDATGNDWIPSHLIVANAAYGTLIKRYKEENTNCDVSSEESFDGSEDLSSTNCLEIGGKSGGGKEGGGKAARIHYRPEQLGSREMVQVMVRNKDPGLKYVNDGDAVVNPFAVDRKTQLADLMRMFCREKAEGGYKCGACGRERQLIREMQQHLLCHSDSKFYLCVRCLKGFNDTFDMKRHTRKHTMVRPYACPQCPSRFSQRCSLEGHLKRVHAMQLQFARHQRREVLRVCERCGFTCDHYVHLLAHTESQHPTDRDAITRLRKRVIAAANRRSPSLATSARAQFTIVFMTPPFSLEGDRDVKTMAEGVATNQIHHYLCTISPINASHVGHRESNKKADMLRPSFTDKKVTVE